MASVRWKFISLLYAESWKCHVLISNSVTLEGEENGLWGSPGHVPSYYCGIVTVPAIVCWGSHPSPRFRVLLERFTAKIYYRERIQNKISKGKEGPMG